jgi:hypothetical protein
VCSGNQRLRAAAFEFVTVTSGWHVFVTGSSKAYFGSLLQRTSTCKNCPRNNAELVARSLRFSETFYARFCRQDITLFIALLGPVESLNKDLIL